MRRIWLRLCNEGEILFGKNNVEATEQKLLCCAKWLCSEASRIHCTTGHLVTFYAWDWIHECDCKKKKTKMHCRIKVTKYMWYGTQFNKKYGVCCNVLQFWICWLVLKCIAMDNIYILFICEENHNLSKYLYKFLQTNQHTHRFINQNLGPIQKSSNLPWLSNKQTNLSKQTNKNHHTTTKDNNK